MRYIDAGYAVALGSLALYAAALGWRLRRLRRAGGERHTARAEVDREHTETGVAGR